jgi:hypothetical protein
MPDPTFDELLSAYLDGEVSPAERELVERLLESSDPVIARETKRRLDALARVSDALRSLPIEAAPPELAPSIRQRAEREQLLASLPLMSAETSEPAIAPLPAVAASVVPALQTSRPAASSPRRLKMWVAVVGSLAATACAVGLMFGPLEWNRWRGSASPGSILARSERPESASGWQDFAVRDTFETASRGHAPLDEMAAESSPTALGVRDPSGETFKAMEDRELAFSKVVSNPAAREREAVEGYARKGMPGNADGSVAAGSPGRPVLEGDAVAQRDAAPSRNGNPEAGNAFRYKSGESAKSLPERLAGTQPRARMNVPSTARSSVNQPMGGGGMGGGGGPAVSNRVAGRAELPRPSAAAAGSGAVEAQAASAAPYGLVANDALGGFIVPSRVGIGQVVPYFSNVEGKIAVIELRVLDFEEAVGGFRILLQENGVASVDASSALGDSDTDSLHRRDADARELPALQDGIARKDGERKKTKVLFAPADKQSLADIKAKRPEDATAATAPPVVFSEPAEGAAVRKSQKEPPAAGPAVASNLRQNNSDAAPGAQKARPQAPETYVLYVDAAPEQIIAAYQQLISVGNGNVMNGIFRNPVSLLDSRDDPSLADSDELRASRMDSAEHGNPSKRALARGPQAKPASKSDAKNEFGSDSRAGLAVTDGKPGEAPLPDGGNRKDGLRQIESQDAIDESNYALSPSQEQQVVSEINRFYVARSQQENLGDPYKTDSDRVVSSRRLAEEVNGKPASGNGLELPGKGVPLPKSNAGEKPLPAAPAVPPQPAFKTPQAPAGEANGKPSPKTSPAGDRSGDAKKESKRDISDNARGTTKPAEQKPSGQPISSPPPPPPRGDEAKLRSISPDDSRHSLVTESLWFGPAIAEVPGEPLPAARSFQYGFRVPIDQEFEGDNSSLSSKDAVALPAKEQGAKAAEFGRQRNSRRDKRALDGPAGAPVGDRNLNPYANGQKSSGGPTADGEAKASETRGENLSAKALGQKVTPSSEKAGEPAASVPSPSVKVLFVFQRAPSPPAAAQPAPIPAKPSAGGK